MYVLLFLGPLITTIGFVVITLTYGGLAFAFREKRAWPPIAASLAVAIAVVYVAVLLTHQEPAPNNLCPFGSPSWWPGWLPL
ncbi:hypothetical protein [Gordonia crocea]|uniref:Uncharacterized protein n=1 Tax=Gordonia crocea TaxID=589162 RepID=A0A7M4BQ72_9ACTN|nr:hypothetical protein [Gordonia crocea]GED96033.1 hypothetical protein nbrc107697_00720 [Gordonia crocea]